ncbi:MAG: VOC family protein [Gammaproteobacteria bacterium]
MIRGIHHVALATSDIDRLVSFYEQGFGFEVIASMGWEVGSTRIDEIVGLKDSSCRQVMMRAGNIHIEIFQYRTPEGRPVDPKRPPSDHGYTHFCVDVTDIDYEYERMKSLGMTFNCPPPTREELGHGAIRAAYGRDPEGNIIELQEVLDPEHPIYLKV